MIEAILIALASAFLIAPGAYSLAWCLVFEIGPWSIFATIRYKATLLGSVPGREWILHGIDCPKCVGFWTTFFLSLFYISWGQWQLFGLVWLASHGLLLLLHFVVMRLIK